MRRFAVPAVLIPAAALALCLAFCDRERSDGRAGPHPLIRDNDIALKAGELGNDAGKCEAFVKSDIRAEAYEGGLRGPVGTLWAGAGNEADRASLLAALLVHCGRQPVVSAVPPHRVELVLRGFAADSSATEISRSVSTADANAVPTRVAIVEENGSLRVSFTDPSDKSLDASKLRRLELVCTSTSPRRPPVVRRRELFTTEFEGYPSAPAAGQRWSVYVTSGWVPDEWKDRELRRADAKPESWMKLHHRIAFGFLARSDAHARRIAAGLGVDVFFDAPRITIVSTGPQGGLDTATLDLRKNDIHCSGEDGKRAAFGTLRSLYDASIESEVLQEATGLPATSAAELLLNAWNGHAATLAERQSLLARSLARLQNETRDGASLSMRPAGKDVPFARVERRDGKLLATLPGSASPAPLTLEDAPREIEVALANAHCLPPDYELEWEFRDGEPPKWYEESRQFYVDFSGRLGFERQVTQLEPSLKVASIDYYDDKESKWLEKPNASTVETAKETLASGDLWTHWYFHNQAGLPAHTTDMISRRSLKELQEKGQTALRYLKEDRTVTEPMRMFLVKRFKFPMRMNDRKEEIPCILMWGDYESKDPAKPAADGPRKQIAEKGTGPINEAWILEDEGCPFVIQLGMFVQSAVDGRVTEAVTGRGVADARVTVRGPGATALSWPDGRFSIPLILEQFREYDVEISAPGYEPLVAKSDFRAAKTFPLAYALTPLPRLDTLVWMTAGDAEAKLARTDVDAHGRRLILDALADRPGLAVCVPTFPVCTDRGVVDAWLEVDPATWEALPRASDGLYGATTGSELLGKAAGKIPPHLIPHAGVSYFAGRIASWYLVAGGALDSVAKMIGGEPMTMKEFHKNAMARAREWAKVYDTWVLKVPGNPIVQGAAFQKGLADGLEWADKFYGEEWK